MAIPAIAAAAAVVGAGYGIYSGERGAKAQQKGLQRQEQAQQKAVAQASSASRKADQANRAANQQQPDVAALLLGDQAKTLPSLLTGQGNKPQQLLLGRKSLLGG